MLIRPGLCALLCLFSVLSAAATAKAPAQKVVFIGDATTYDWGVPADSAAFPANPKWINKGLTGRQTSAAILARFAADVVSQRPAIVHILAGAVDISMVDDANRPFLVQNFQSNLTAMVAQATHANIQVILGTIPPQLIANAVEQPQVWQVFEPTLTQNLNAWIESYGAQNHILVINYHDLLCACVGSTNPAPSGVYPLMAGTGTTPSPAGYAAMTAVTMSAITTFDLTLDWGFVQAANNVATLTQGDSLSFNAYGVYSDGIPRAMVNTNYAGLAGTWASSDPDVLIIGYNGLAQGLSPGDATVTFTDLNGLAYNQAVITVRSP